MSEGTQKNAELWRRIEAFLAAGQFGGLTAAELAEFEQLLRDDEAARDLYVDMVEMSVLLPRAMSSLCGEKGEAAADGDDPLCIDALMAPAASHVSFPTAAFNLVGRGYRNTTAFFSQEAPLGFLIASIILVVALWVGSKITVSYNVPQPPQAVVAQQKMPAVEAAKDGEIDVNGADGLEKKLADAGVVVARLTDSADCRWKLGDGAWRVGFGESATAKQPGPSRLGIGDKLTLASGFLEITYDAGAKVILQAPCTYRVESPASGFLALGRLTARLEKADKTRRLGDEETRRLRVPPVQPCSKGMQQNLPVSPSPSLLVSSRPSFAIRTTTATVTDLGTEFGVETDGRETHTYVFVGAVEVMRAIGHQGKPEVVRLAKNESLTVNHSGMARPSASLAAQNRGQHFVRVIPPAMRRMVEELSGGKIVFQERFRQISFAPASVYRHFLFDLQGHDVVNVSPVQSVAKKDGAEVKARKEDKPTVVRSSAIARAGLLELHRCSSDETAKNYDSVILTHPFSGHAVVAVDVGLAGPTAGAMSKWLPADVAGRACPIVRVGRYDFSLFPGKTASQGQGEMAIDGPGLKRPLRVACPFVPELGRLHHVFICFDGRQRFQIYVVDGLNPSNILEATFDAPQPMASPYAVGVRCRGVSCTATFANFRVIQFPWDAGSGNGE